MGHGGHRGGGSRERKVLWVPPVTGEVLRAVTETQKTTRFM